MPQVLGWIYFCWLYNNPDAAQFFVFERDIIALVAYFISLISISAFGYLLNDWCDVNTDAVSGKENRLSKLKPTVQALVVIIPLLLGCLTWREGISPATILFALQIAALIAYSLPPVRLKTRTGWGVAADALYGHINPTFITLFAFGFFAKVVDWHTLLTGSIIFVAVSLKGIRNILLHQIDDRKKDKLADIQTFVVKNGALFSLLLVNNLLMFEVIFTVILSLVISMAFPPFFICGLVFSIITYLKFSGWKLAYIPQRQLKFKFLYFLNDYYEDWVPVFFLLLLAVRQPEFLFLLLLHLILFPSFLIKLRTDLRTIHQNLKTEDDY